MELVDVMHIRKMDIICLLQETNWRGAKAKKLGDEYRLLYLGVNETRNKMIIMVGQELKDNMVNVRRFDDIILRIKPLLEKK